MKFLRGWGAALAASVLLVSGACQGEAETGPPAVQAARKIDVTVDSANGPHVFHVELARTTAEQERGLMFRTNIPQDGGMLFAPYPADGPPREASFWMKNTPTALDILFIREDGTIARIGENAVPFSEENVKSGEPVAAVLEINAGVSAKLGIRAGDKVRWAKQ
ncbi:DUF192 domain-containing protein [Nostoc ellipsosporum NOK]|uniref:DUF192 domain-containing protein n=1 Tax=Sphingomonas sp. IBVSS2 TaxID=1985172 RepID=UPI000A2EB676|nr:DUF192 domain-containing protein [Sphingomonas sp. IBVSS2]MDF2386127.1 DUF192 domain-containing protein [Nostoc ellipsosporum NOK]OSZ65108.1 hypothetical protein CAP40_14960 [Sphingomonas sp. IBVSS2]